MAESFIPLTTSNLGGSISSIASAVDTNFSTIKTLLNDLLSRSGSAPNTMASSLDMNSNSIINLPFPGSSTSPVRLQDISSQSNVVGATGPQGPQGTAGSLTNLPAGITFNNTPSGPANSFLYGNIQASGTAAASSGSVVNLGYLSFGDRMDINQSVNSNGGWIVSITDNLINPAKGGRSVLVTTFNFISSGDPGLNREYGCSNDYCVASGNNGGTSSNLAGGCSGILIATNPYALLKTGATFWTACCGQEIDIGIASGASSRELIGLNIGLLPDNAVNAFAYSTAITFGSANNSPTFGLDYLFLYGNYAGYPGLKPAGTIFGAYPHANSGNCGTIANAFDLNNFASITGYILRGPGANGYIDGNFNITMPNMPTSNPGVAGRLWNNAGIVNVSAG